MHSLVILSFLSLQTFPFTSKTSEKIPQTVQMVEKRTEVACTSVLEYTSGRVWLYWLSHGANIPVVYV